MQKTASNEQIEFISMHVIIKLPCLARQWQYVVSIKRFVSAAILQSGKKADVLITVKESQVNGHRIYSIELDEINKASERFEGLSDAAEKDSGQGN